MTPGRLPTFARAFDAFRLHAEGCDVPFASSRAPTWIMPHRHDSDIVGVITRGQQ